MNNKILLWLVLIIVGFGIWSAISNTGSLMFNPKGEEIVRDKPYEKYSFENLVKRGGVVSKIEVVGNKFYYQSEGRRISGEINMPSDLSGDSRKVPVVVMARGYVDKEIYKTGIGTHNSAMVYAKNGFITLAPDFSGYGDSDPEDSNALGARLTKPVEILDLIASIRASHDTSLQTSESPIYLWGHSNGGQIMLSVAEILGKGISEKVRGVTLWAPVSKPFPYNILYYTDDATDSGKWLRGQVSEFERDYDVFNYSVDRYLDWINIPVQLHQGSNDEAVPKIWSDQLADRLKVLGKSVNYYVYPGADHNMRSAWDVVVSRDVEWFNQLSKEEL
jgi:pimeloyl-ACP methyl ester carboxylesterase